MTTSSSLLLDASRSINPPTLLKSISLVLPQVSLDCSFLPPDPVKASTCQSLACLFALLWKALYESCLNMHTQLCSPTFRWQHRVHLTHALLMVVFLWSYKILQHSNTCHLRVCCNLRGLEDYLSKKCPASENITNFPEELPAQEEVHWALPWNLPSSIPLCSACPMPSNQEPMKQGSQEWGHRLHPSPFYYQCRGKAKLEGKAGYT